MYNKKRTMIKKIFTAEYTDEAKIQLRELSQIYRNRIATAISIFEEVGTDYKNINSLDFDLYEIKPEGVRAYFRYDETKKCIIIVGFICLKKTQKAPRRYMKQAVKNIENYLQNRNKERNI